MDLKLGHWVYDIGTFIKHCKFRYEKEQRIKVQLLSSDITVGICNVGDVHAALYGLTSLDEVLEKSIEMLEEVRKQYLLRNELINDLKYIDAYNNTEYLVIGDISPHIVEKIYLFNSISDEERRRIYEWASRYRIYVVELSK